MSCDEEMSRVFKNRRGKGVMDLSCPSSMPGNTLLVADPSTYGDSRSLREEDAAMEGPKPTTTVTETTTVLAESAVSAAQVAPGHTLCTEIPTDDDSDGYVVSLPTGEQDFPQSFPSLPSLDAIRFDSNIMYDFTVSPAILKELFVVSRCACAFGRMSFERPRVSSAELRL